MEKKRSRGVTVFGVLIIIGSVFGLLGARDGWKFNPPASNYLYLVLLPLSIVVAVFLFNLKNWARVAIIVISLIVAVETLITTPYALARVNEYGLKDAEKTIDAQIAAAEMNKKPNAPKLTDEQIAQAKKMAMEAAKKIMQGMMAVVIAISIGFNCGAIYFFTHPKVREQFS